VNRRVTTLLALIALLTTVAAPAATLEGRVIWREQAVAGMTVSAYAALDPSSPALATVQSDADGSFALQLPAGSYALFGRDDERGLFAFCGRNPVSLASAESSEWAGMQAVELSAVQREAYDDAYAAAIEGRVLRDGEPVADAYVYLYLDPSEDLKGQGYRLSQPTAADGFFSFDGLPESNYYLVARKRQNGQRVGPMREGDLLGVYPGNPLTARAGQRAQLLLPVVEKLKSAVDSETFGRADGPVLEGVVVDDQGQGVAGVHVFAYTDPVIGHRRPAALSTVTGADGRFTVNLPAAGTYYVGARQQYGDSPAPGELFGMYEESADHGLTVRAGERVEPLRIRVEPLEIF
jgi:hypothetical protein